MGDTCTQAQAETWLLADLHQFDLTLKKQKFWPKLKNHQQAALLCFVYNLGSWGDTMEAALQRYGQVQNTNTCRDVVNAIQLYNKANGQVLRGLSKRRYAEGQLFWGCTPQEAIRRAVILYP